MNDLPAALKAALDKANLSLSGPAGADEASQPAPENGNRPLPDLHSVVVEKLTPEERAERIAIALERRQWVHEAAKKVMAIQERIQFLETIIADGGIPLPEDVEELKALQELLEQISSAGDEQVRRHLEFAEFLEAMRIAAPTAENVEYFLREVVARNHYRIVSREEAQAIWTKKISAPQGAIFFKGRIYLPVWEGDKKWPSQRAVESTLVKFVRAALRAEQAETKSAIARLKEQGNPDLAALSRGELGIYRIYFPARTDERGKRWTEGVGLVEVYIHKVSDRDVRFVRPREGAGSLGWFNEFTRGFIPHAWIHNGVPDKISDEKIRDFAEKFIRTIKGAVKTWYAERIRAAGQRQKIRRDP